MRAPPESFKPITGAPIFAARSIILTIFPAFDVAIAGDEAIAVRLLLGHTEVAAAVRNQFVGLFKGAVVKQELDALPRRHFAFLVLALAPLLPSAGFGELVALLQFCNFFFEVHG